MAKLTINSVVSCLAIFFLPSSISALILRLLGHPVQSGVKFGFSLILVDKLIIHKGAKIGHFNLIQIKRLRCGPSSSIGRSNILYGPFSTALGEHASIGNRNKIIRNTNPKVCDWSSQIILKRGALITSGHYIDCTRRVIFESFSILAGVGSQVWTHGYIHAPTGPGRYRIDGSVEIGNNVYIGSRCILNCGVKVNSAITIGAGAVISKTLTKPGVYVSSPLRYLPPPKDPMTRSDLRREESRNLCEIVYTKINKSSDQIPRVCDIENKHQTININPHP